MSKKNTTKIQSFGKASAWTPAQMWMSTTSTIAATGVTLNRWRLNRRCCYQHWGHRGCIRRRRLGTVPMESGECTLLQLDCVGRHECLLWNLRKKGKLKTLTAYLTKKTKTAYTQASKQREFFGKQAGACLSCHLRLLVHRCTSQCWLALGASYSCWWFLIDEGKTITKLQLHGRSAV